MYFGLLLQCFMAPRANLIQLLAQIVCNTSFYNHEAKSPEQVSEDDTAPATWRPGGPVVEAAKAAAPSKK